MATGRITLHLSAIPEVDLELRNILAFLIEETGSVSEDGRPSPSTLVRRLCWGTVAALSAGEADEVVAALAGIMSRGEGIEQEYRQAVKSRRIENLHNVNQEAVNGR